MITNELKNQVDKIWETFWTGGISNPLTVVEQFTFLIFIKSLDPNVKDIFTVEKQHLRWENVSALAAEQMFEIFQTEMFPFIKTLSCEQSAFATLTYRDNRIVLLAHKTLKSPSRVWAYGSRVTGEAHEMSDLNVG